MSRWGVEWANYDFNAIRCLLMARIAYTFDTLFFFFSYVLLLINFLLLFSALCKTLSVERFLLWRRCLLRRIAMMTRRREGGTLSLATT